MGKEFSKKLIDVIYNQLKESGNFTKVSKGKFDDKSGFWIECWTNDLPNSEGFRYTKELSFNGKGTVLEDVKIWKEQIQWGDTTEVR